MIDIANGRLSVADATGPLEVRRRQVYRLLDAFRACGPDGLISRKLGRPSNRALGSVFRETVLAIVRERYSDFGPTLAAEKLSELHGLDLGVETLRQWMIDAGLWVRRKDDQRRARPSEGPGALCQRVLSMGDSAKVALLGEALGIASSASFAGRAAHRSRKPTAEPLQASLAGMLATGGQRRAAL